MTGVFRREPDLGTPLALDSGEHRVEVAADGKVSRSYVVRISGAGTTEIVIDELDDAPPRAAVPATVAPQSPASHPVVTPTAPVPAADEKRGGAQRTVGLVLVGAGVIGLGAGAWFGGRALSESGEANRACPTRNSCPDGGNEADEANDRARDSFKVSVGPTGVSLGVVGTF